MRSEWVLRKRNCNVTTVLGRLRCLVWLMTEFRKVCSWTTVYSVMETQEIPAHFVSLLQLINVVYCLIQLRPSQNITIIILVPVTHTSGDQIIRNCLKINSFLSKCVVILICMCMYDSFHNFVTQKALGRVHTSTKAQQSPFVFTLDTSHMNMPDLFW